MVKLSENTCYITIVLLTLLETQNTVSGGLLGQYFLSTPINTTVNAGSHVRLSCRVGRIAGECSWTRDGFSLGSSRAMGGYSRYLMPGSVEDICDLSIDPVLPVDEGLYQCLVSGGHGIPPIAAAPVTLKVNSEPGQPFILQAREEEVLEVQEGEEVELQCESQGGRPPAEIMWWDGEGRRIVSDVTEHVKRMEDRKTFKTVSTLRFKPSTGQQVKCSAHNDAFPAMRLSHGLLIEVLGQLRVQVEQLGEGESVRISCVDSKVDKAIRFRWFINDVELFDETENVLEIHQFSKSYDKSKVKCSVADQNNIEEVIKIVELLHNPNTVEVPVILPSTHKIISKVAEKRMLTCIVTEDSLAEVDGELNQGEKDDAIAVAYEGKQYKCKVIPNGRKKLSRISSNMKKISRTLRKFSNTLLRVNTLIDET